MKVCGKCGASKSCLEFDLTELEGQLRCFHCSNFQPLWAGDNWSKGSKWEE